jgi:O6-methylguanine-DNA--protein-cysteine methyltransferase
MTAPAEQLAPHGFRTKTMDRAAAAQAAAAETTSKLAELKAKRDAALLLDDDAAAIAFGRELDALAQQARAHADKAALLREQDAREVAQKRAKEVEAQCKRIDILFDLRSETVEKLVELEKQRVKLWRQVLAANRKIAAGHAWTAGDLSAIIASPLAVNTVMSHELYRLSHIPLRLGGQPEDVDAGLSLVGAKSPRVEWMLQPARITPLTEVITSAGEYGKRALRGMAINGVPVVAVPVNGGEAAQAPAVEATGSNAPVEKRAGGANVSGDGDGAPVELSAAERQIAVALRQLAEAAEDQSPAGELKYQEALKRVSALQDVVSGEKQNGRG